MKTIIYSIISRALTELKTSVTPEEWVLWKHGIKIKQSMKETQSECCQQISSVSFKLVHQYRFSDTWKFNNILSWLSLVFGIGSLLSSTWYKKPTEIYNFVSFAWPTFRFSLEINLPFKTSSIIAATFGFLDAEFYSRGCFDGMIKHWSIWYWFWHLFQLLSNFCNYLECLPELRWFL